MKYIRILLKKKKGKSINKKALERQKKESNLDIDKRIYQNQKKNLEKLKKDRLNLKDKHNKR